MISWIIAYVVCGLFFIVIFALIDALTWDDKPATRGMYWVAFLIWPIVLLLFAWGLLVKGEQL